MISTSMTCAVPDLEKSWFQDLLWRSKGVLIALPFHTVSDSAISGKLKASFRRGHRWVEAAMSDPTVIMWFPPTLLADLQEAKAESLNFCSSRLLIDAIVRVDISCILIAAVSLEDLDDTVSPG